MNGINHHALRFLNFWLRRTDAVWRGFNYYLLLISSTLRALWLSKDFDVIFCYTTSPVLMANAAVKMKKRTGKILFLYCLDLWPESLKAWDIKIHRCCTGI